MTRRVHRMVWMIMVATMAAGWGCSSRAQMDWLYVHKNMETTGETPEEHRERVYRTLEQDRRMMADDLDLLFMTERPSRLTRWHSR